MNHATLPDGRFVAVAEDVTAIAARGSVYANKALTDPDGAAARMLDFERTWRRGNPRLYTAAEQASIDAELRSWWRKAMAGETV